MSEARSTVPEARPVTAPASGDAFDPRWINWRVLLPSPGHGFSHLVLLGGPEGLETLITRLGIAERVSRELPTSDLVDAVVVLADSSHAVSAHDVAASLRSGGWLYWEITRRNAVPPGLTAGRVRRALQRAGFSTTGQYWVRPPAGAGMDFVPLDVRGAVGWYLSAFSQPWLGALAARFPRWARRIVTAAAGRIGVTAVARGGARTPPALLEPGPMSSRLGSEVLRPVVHFREHGRRTVVFPFTATGELPVAVLKFSPVRERSYRTREEQETLSKIRIRLDPAMRRTVPEPLGLVEWSGVSVGIESYVPGQSIERMASLPTVSFSKMAADLELVTAWLCRFQLANSFGRPQWGGEEWSLEKWVEAPLRHLEREFALPPDVESLFAATRRAAQKLAGSPLPLVLSNSSFSRGNVCRSAHGIAVYDWETVGRGLPLVDLMYFLVDWGRLVQKASAASWPRTFRDLLIDPPGDRVSRAIDRAVSTYFAALAIDPRFRPLLGALTWIHRAERRASKDGNARRSLDPRLLAFAEGGGRRLDE